MNGKTQEHPKHNKHISTYTKVQNHMVILNT